ncbi:MAG: hypothetical protein KDM81_13190 [Verrucomicrobiae bacterium]|nr:hypothetical protein [Verrucomicrobiae bacterium]
MNQLSNLTLAVIIAFTLLAPGPAGAQGMSAEERSSIHTLLNGHAELTREVRLTPEGYVAITETDNPALAKVLQEHVGQMEQRLGSGRMVRRWDPAFAEFIPHYPDINHRIEKTAKGLKVTVTGRTPEAVKVARNHARVVSDFVKTGWEGHDRLHPAVLDQPGKPATTTAGRGRGRGRGAGMGPPWLRNNAASAASGQEPSAPAGNQGTGTPGCCEAGAETGCAAGCAETTGQTDCPPTETGTPPATAAPVQPPAP